jgi:hypothetical protein
VDFDAAAVVNETKFPKPVHETAYARASLTGGAPEPMIAKISQETLAEMIGTTQTP